MNKQACPVEHLKAFASDPNASESQALSESLIEHLDHCEACRQQLEHSIASHSEWQQVAHALSGDDASDYLTEESVATEPQQPRQSDTQLLLEPKSADADATEFLTSLSLQDILAPTDLPRSAGRIGTFEILGLVGSGGMGIVLKAQEPALDRIVAIKVLAPHLATSQSARKRFAREARAAAAVIHENIIPIYQVAEWNQLPYLVMPFHPEPTLGQRIEKTGQLDLESTLSIGMQVARGLAAAHAQGLVHRDVKPANILLSKGTERAIITDFGLARTADDASLTCAGTLAGTPHYMSPEQARGEKVNSKSDLFSLGSVLFAMASGRPPVNMEQGTDTIERIRKTELDELPVNENCPVWLLRLIRKLHSPKPLKRPASAERIAMLLEQCLAHVRQPGQVELPQELAERPRGLQSRKLTSIAILLALLTVSALAIAMVNWPSSLQPGVGPGTSASSEEQDPSEESKSSIPQSGTQDHANNTVQEPTNDEKAQETAQGLTTDPVQSQLDSLKTALDTLEQEIRNSPWEDLESETKK